MSKKGHPHSHEQEPDQVESKTRIKQECHALKAMGIRLTELKAAELEKLPLTQNLQNAINEAHLIKSNNARKRHFGYIGKLMQYQDIPAIETLLNRIDASHQTNTNYFHQLENWRDGLLGDASCSTLTKFIKLYPQADAQHIRQLIRNAQKESKQNKPLASSRKLFRYIRSVTEGSIDEADL